MITYYGLGLLFKLEAAGGGGARSSYQKSGIGGMKLFTFVQQLTLIVVENTSGSTKTKTGVAQTSIGDSKEECSCKTWQKNLMTADLV